MRIFEDLFLGTCGELLISLENQQFATHRFKGFWKD
jgi:hypothetical protein